MHNSGANGYLAFDHRQAQTWLAAQDPPPARGIDIVAVAGHSYGGHRANLFVEQLRRNLGLTANLLAAVDPVNWTTCNLDDLGPLVLGLSNGCDQKNDLLVGPPSLASSVLGFKQVKGIQLNVLLPNPLNLVRPLTGYPIRNDPNPRTIDAYHNSCNGCSPGIADDTDHVRKPILSSLKSIVSLAQSPQEVPRVSVVPGVATRANGTIVVPVKLSAAGSGVAAAARIVSASFNGMPSNNTPVVFGDIAAGSSSASIGLAFPDTAAQKGAAVLLTVTGVHSYGTQFSGTFRFVAP